MTVIEIYKKISTLWAAESQSRSFAGETGQGAEPKACVGGVSDGGTPSPPFLRHHRVFGLEIKLKTIKESMAGGAELCVPQVLQPLFDRGRQKSPARAWGGEETPNKGLNPILLLSVPSARK